MTLSLSRPPGPPTIGPGPLTTGGRSDLPPLAAARPIVRCALATTALLVTRRLHQPTENKGRVIRFGDGTAAAVYRETRIDHDASQPALLVVGFRLRWVKRRWSHSVFRATSVLNTVLFAGFPGLVSKLWLRADEVGRYRGVYEWDDAELALGYVNALWWALALVSVPGSIRFAVVPGVRPDQALHEPSALEALSGTEMAWWRPVVAGPAVQLDWGIAATVRPGADRL